jgi:transcriptional regulator with GAF, ATPase, and Fis domain/truncated hemoglobin YjbI
LEIVAVSAAFRRCVWEVDTVAETEATALLLGESGTGKELLARRLHEKSRRAQGPLVIVNCGAVPRELFESEFFGHAQGAFTGASKARKGRFEMADGGTLFLDEVGDIPPELQGKLLRALQQMRFERLGEEHSRDVNVRVVAATNRPLVDDVEAGRFRSDLYYRISAFPISIPPLRDRRDDIPALVVALLGEIALLSGLPVPKESSRGLRMLTDYDWPGNVRELRNVLERAVILGRATNSLEIEQALAPALPRPRAILSSSDKPPASSRSYLTETEFRELERENYIAALEAAAWRVSGTDGAAALLGLKSTTLSSRLATLEIQSPAKNSLYMRLGGASHIHAFARDLFGRILPDPSLGRFWRQRSGIGIEREVRLSTSFICRTTGGPQRYSGRDMIQAHASLGITEEDWDRFLSHFDEACRVVGFEEGAARALRELVLGMRKTIVQN